MEPNFKSVKGEALRLIQRLPDDCTMKTVLHQMELLAGVLEGVKAAEDGRVMTQDDAERRSAEWLPLSRQLQFGSGGIRSPERRNA